MQPAVLLTDGVNPFAYCGYDPMNRIDVDGGSSRNSQFLDSVKNLMKQRKPGTGWPGGPLGGSSSNSPSTGDGDEESGGDGKVKPAGLLTGELEGRPIEYDVFEMLGLGYLVPPEMSNTSGGGWVQLCQTDMSFNILKALGYHHLSVRTEKYPSGVGVYPGEYFYAQFKGDPGDFTTKCVQLKGINVDRLNFLIQPEFTPNWITGNPFYVPATNDCRIFTGKVLEYSAETLGLQVFYHYGGVNIVTGASFGSWR